MSTSIHERTGSTGGYTDRNLSYFSGVRVVFSLEMRQRLRARAWYIMLVIWFVVIGLVFMLAAISTAAMASAGGSGPILFDLVVGFVLLFGLLVAPGLSANAINGDRAAGTLAIMQVTLLRPGQILTGKWLASWIASLGFLVLSVPFILWALALGGVNPAEAIVSLVMLAVELGLVSAIGIGISALANRPLFSIVTTYMVVALLGIGTLITFGLSLQLVEERNVEITSTYYGYPPDTVFTDSGPAPGSEQSCFSDTYVGSVYHTERTAWLLAANPFVIVADSVPYTRAQVQPGQSSPLTSEYVSPGVMEMISESVRAAQAGSGYEMTCAEAQGTARNVPEGQFPIWPLGLALQSALAGGLIWLGRRKLVTPVRRLAKGTRIA